MDNQVEFTFISIIFCIIFSFIKTWARVTKNIFFIHFMQGYTHNFIEGILGILTVACSKGAGFSYTLPASVITKLHKMVLLPRQKVTIEYFYVTERDCWVMLKKREDIWRSPDSFFLITIIEISETKDSVEPLKFV